MKQEFVKKTTPSFKDLVKKEQVFAPCVWDCRTSHAAELLGFKALMLSGGQLAESVAGLPDIGLITSMLMMVLAIRLLRHGD